MLALLTATAIAAQTAVPYPVSVPVLEPLKLCYVTVQTGPETLETESIRVAGSGFTPNSFVDVTLDDEVAVSGAAITSAGVLPAGLIASPPILSGQRVFELTATERDNPAQTISLESYLSALTVKVTPKRAKPDSRVRFRGRGFTDRGGIFAHYLRKGELRKTVRLTKVASGACGRFSVRAPQFPFEPERGTWRVQIDQHRKLSRDGPLINLTIDVRRRPKTR